jgi:hypothetical protein
MIRRYRLFDERSWNLVPGYYMKPDRFYEKAEGKSLLRETAEADIARRERYVPNDAGASA